MYTHVPAWKLCYWLIPYTLFHKLNIHSYSQTDYIGTRTSFQSKVILLYFVVTTDNKDSRMDDRILPMSPC